MQAKSVSPDHRPTARAEKLEQIMRNSAASLPQAMVGPGHTARHLWRAIGALELAFRIRRERRLLAGLDERALKDIGFTAAEAHAESTRLIWDLPVDRLRI